MQTSVLIKSALRASHTFPKCVPSVVGKMGKLNTASQFRHMATQKAKATPSSTTKKSNSSGKDDALLVWVVAGALTIAAAAGFKYHQDSKPELLSHVQLSAYDSAMKKRAAALELLDAVSKSERPQELNNMDILTEAEANAIIQKQEKIWALDTIKGPVKLQVYSNQVSSNPRIEDYITCMPLESSKGPDGKHSQHMFGVFDGHSGYMCAEQLQARLGAKLDKAIEAVRMASSWYSSICVSSNDLIQTIKQLKKESNGEWHQLSLAVAASFVNMDKELVEDSVAEYRKTPTPENLDRLLAPTISGSCGLVAVLDTAANEIVVGNVGDSQAIIGYQKPDGTWGAKAMSTDQNVQMNNKEILRVIQEHPGEENAIRNGRILGGLMPSRAFGNCKYKWPAEWQDEFFPQLAARGHKVASKKTHYISPPYVTARPDLIWQKLDGTEKFLVLVTDGISDMMSNEEIASVLGQWYDARSSSDDSLQKPALPIMDDNPASLLIKCALGRDALSRIDEKTYHERLTIPAPHSRYYRDDMSAFVITLEQNSLAADSSNSDSNS